MTFFPPITASRGLTIKAEVERFALKEPFSISRDSRDEAVVVTATISDGAVIGRGECTPYKRYGETVEGVVADISAAPLDSAQLHAQMRAGAARNAVDCALWDLAAKRAGKSVSVLAGLPPPKPVDTFYTISLNAPAVMAEAARRHADKPRLKLKLGLPDDDIARLWAIRKARPDARLIVDANEGWTEGSLVKLLAACAEYGVELVEQPLPAAADGALAVIKRCVPVCADESFHTRADLPTLCNRYDAVNIKLDKAGGLSEALEIAERGLSHGMKLMVGCMLSSSLAIAPAMIVAAAAEWVDLDAPLLLAADRSPPMLYEGTRISSAVSELWG